MNRTTKIKITELNPHVICVLCGGYYINATTITECLHSFCRTCITRYLETSKYCPVCDVMVHKTRPLDYIRSDKTLQDLVYKLVPGLYKSEMKRRREYYAAVDTPGVSQSPSEDRGDEFFDRIIYTEDEKISLSLELCAEGIPFKTPLNVHGHTGPENIRIKDVRYLQCPAAFSIGNLKKFIRMKFDLKMKFEIDIFHTAEPLPDYYSLMDIAYIYTWTRRAPLRLYYTVFERKIPPKAPDLIARYQTNKVDNGNEERETIPAKSAKAEDKTISRKRKLLEGPDDISPDLDFEKCKPYRGDRRKGTVGTPKKRAKKALVEVDDSVNEAMSESEEQLAKLTLDCSRETRNVVGESGNMNGDDTDNDINGDKDEDEVKTVDGKNHKENVQTILKTPNKTKLDDKSSTEVHTNITVETNTLTRSVESDKNGAIQTEIENSSSKQSSTQVSPGSGSISLSLFQPLNQVEEESETANSNDKSSDKMIDNTFEFQSEESSNMSLKKSRGRPKGSKNKVTNDMANSSKDKLKETKTDIETKATLVVSKKHPGMKSPKANKKAKDSNTKAENQSKKSLAKGKLNKDDNNVVVTDKVNPENGVKTKRKYVRKNKAGNSNENGREAKRPKNESSAVDEKSIGKVAAFSEKLNERLEGNKKTSSDIDGVSESVSERPKDLSEQETLQKQSENERNCGQSQVVEKVIESEQEKQLSVNSSSLQEPVTPLYGETPKANESNQGLPCSPNMENFDDSGRLVIDTSVNSDDLDGAKTQDDSEEVVVKCNKAQSNGALNENIKMKNDFVANRALSKDFFRNGFGIINGNQSVNTSLNSSDIPNAHTDQFRNAINGLSPTNALSMLGGFSTIPMTAHVNIGHMTGNTNSFQAHDLNFDQPLDLTNNGGREEYTKGKIFKTKMLKKTYPKPENVQCFKENGKGSVNQIPH